MKKIIKGMLLLLIVSSAWHLSGRVACAASGDEELDRIVDEMYHQLVVEGKNEAVACSDAPEYGAGEIIRELFGRDDPDNPYDGNTLEVRGPSWDFNTWKRTGARSRFYYFRLINGCDIKEADEVVSKAADEIYGEIGWDATDREKLYAIGDYLAAHLYYDYRQMDQINEYDEKLREYNRREISEKPELVGVANGIQALSSEDHGTICSGFALATCLIAHEMGLDCKVAIGEKHAYNMVRLDGADSYIEWDSCCPIYGAVTKRRKLMDLMSKKSYANKGDSSIYRNIFEIENIPQVAFEASRGRIRSPKDVLDIAVKVFPVTTCLMLDIIFVAVAWFAWAVVDRRRLRSRMRDYEGYLYMDDFMEDTFPYPE